MNNANNIFHIPVGDLLDLPADSYFITYSPLAESMVLMSADEVELLKRGLDGEDITSSDISATLKSLIQYDPIEMRNDQIRSCRDFVTLYVLPNYICNFACTYCFAAHGRDKQKLDIQQLISMLDWMLDPNRTSERKIHVTFLGGGEPAMSFNVIKDAIIHANQRARQSGFEIVWNIVTNGSLVDDEMLDFFKTENVIVRYSFEIIEKIQENQRGNFSKVDTSIRKACEKGMSPVIRAMITPLNVDRIPEMVEIVADKYPGVKLLKFDPITDASFGQDLSAMARFYESYNNNFMKAKQVGLLHAIDVQCVVIRNLDSVISRFCAGEISLNGYGEITACHRVSSPKEKGYADSRYGYVDDKGVHIDEKRFLKITSDKVQTKTRCLDCFLKYNCAGGCHAQNQEYSYHMQQIVCHYSRELSRRELFNRLNDSVIEECGRSIKEIINR